MQYETGAKAPPMQMAVTLDNINNQMLVNYLFVDFQAGLIGTRENVSWESRDNAGEAKKNYAQCGIIITYCIWYFGSLSFGQCHALPFGSL